MGIYSSQHRRLADRPIDGLVAPIYNSSQPGFFGESPAEANSNPDKKRTTPALEKFGTDITSQVKAGSVQPVTGREDPLERLIMVLGRRTKSNPLIIGEPGVGKSALVQAFAARVAEGLVPSTMREKRVIAIDIPALIAGAEAAGQLEKRVTALLGDIRSSANVILVLEDLHTAINAGIVEGGVSFSSMLSLALERREVQCIGTANLKDYSRYLERSELARNFQPIVLDAPTLEETRKMLFQARPEYEFHHQVRFTDEALSIVPKLAKKFFPAKQLPDSAFDIIDEAGAASTVKRGVRFDVSEINSMIDRLSDAACEVAVREDIEGAERVGLQIKTLEQERARLIEEHDALVRPLDVISVGEVQATVSRLAGIPLSALKVASEQSFVNVEEVLGQRVFGQPEAVRALASAVRRHNSGIKDPAKSIGSFMFVSRGGSAEHELAGALAELLFGSEESLVTVHMSEYMDKSSISRLIGAPPGFVGYEDGGILTNKIQFQPHSVVLCDGIENAHPLVLHLLLQAMEERRLTDGAGRSVDFSNVVFILTSYLGSDVASFTPIGLQAVTDHTSQEQDVRIREKIEQYFAPELLNRLSCEPIILNQVGRKQARALFANELGRLESHVQTRLGKEVALKITAPALRYLESLVKWGEGANGVRQVIEQHVTPLIADAIIRGDLLGFDLKRLQQEHSDQLFLGESPTVYIKNNELRVKASRSTPKSLAS